MVSLHDDAFISEYTPITEGLRSKAIQANRFIPVQVDVTVEKTLGRAIIDAVNANVALAKAFGITILAINTMTKQDELRILDNVLYVAFIKPAAPITIKAYLGATAHAAVAPAAVDTYKPVTNMLRNYTSGGVVLLDVGFIA